jgi:hypothetical protein
MPPLVSCNFVAPFYKDLARFSRAREKKEREHDYVKLNTTIHDM